MVNEDSDTTVPLIEYSTYISLEYVKKVKISEVENNSEAKEKVEKEFHLTGKYAAKEKTFFIDGTWYDEWITTDGKTVYLLKAKDYFFVNFDIYKVSISDGIPQKPELYANDVLTSHNVDLTDDNKLVYYKGDMSTENTATQIYVDGKK